MMAIFRTTFLSLLLASTSAVYGEVDDYYAHTEFPTDIFSYESSGSDDDTLSEDTCDEGKVACPLPWGNCVTKCNCRFDCYNSAADEQNCTDDHANFPRIFTCLDESAHVFMPGFCGDEGIVDGLSYFCDGHAACADESDEPKGVFGFKCRVNPGSDRPEYRKEMRTLPEEYIERWKNLDFVEDYLKHAICPDEADVCYINGSSKLNTSKCFQCLDGTVIRLEQMCDNKIDCRDLSDECLCTNSSQSTKEFCQLQKQSEASPDKLACGDLRTNTYAFVDKDDFCHSNTGCNESLCPVMSKRNASDYLCKSKVGNVRDTKAQKCDGRPECPDLDDECNDNCPKRPKYCNESTLAVLSSCSNKTSITNSNQNFLICDGEQDCPNGRDEEDCWQRRSCGGEAPNRTYDEAERCDFIMDCDSGADELHCDGRFYCDDKAAPGLRPSQVGDGKLDCESGEDECGYEESSFSSGQQMIKSFFIVVCMWIMATLALFGNALVIFTCAKDLRETYRRGAAAAVRARVGVCNKTLVLNLALADFLMGIYLLILGIKAIEYNSNYCAKWQEWRWSELCAGTGALAMLSSQASVLVMVMMTTYRFYSVRSPFRAERLKARYLVAGIIIFCWVPPLFLAFMPLRGDNTLAFAFQSFTKLPYFDSVVVEKPQLQQLVEKAWIMTGGTMDNFGGTRWEDLIAKLCELLGKVCPEEQSQIAEKWYGYYSADSVCLPRLFPHVNDGGWDYTAGVIIFDFVAFIYILLTYTMMYVCTVRTSNEHRNGTIVFGRGSSFSSADELRSREDRVIWQRISRLLITDFLCWMPICITCIVSLTQHNVPPLMYQISAAFFLPINSALNPLLYSNVVYKMVDRFFSKVLGCVGLFEHENSSNSTPPNGRHAQSTNSARANGVASNAVDEMRVSRDHLAPETRSLTVSETDRNRNVVITPCARPLSTRSCSGSGVKSREEELRGGIAHSVARFTRFFSERRMNDQKVDDRATFPRHHRPKSQSTTSTSTTFTSCGQDV